ncbi:MAG: tRNA adenosine(34) deaminase TadA [Porcipelethomonas sp.]
MTDLDYMKEAVSLAEKAAEIDEVPVGAIVVKKPTGEIVGRGYNRRETDKDPLAHAEITAIKEASEKLGGWRLIGCEMFVTLEPCPMCCGAIINSRIERVVFGAYDKKSGAAESVVKMFELPFNHKPEILAGVMEEECSYLLTEFFSKLRQKRKKDKESRQEI